MASDGIRWLSNIDSVAFLIITVDGFILLFGWNGGRLVAVVVCADVGDLFVGSVRRVAVAVAVFAEISSRSPNWIPINQGRRSFCYSFVVVPLFAVVFIRQTIDDDYLILWRHFPSFAICFLTLVLVDETENGRTTGETVLLRSLVGNCAFLLLSTESLELCLSADGLFNSSNSVFLFHFLAEHSCRFSWQWQWFQYQQRKCASVSLRSVIQIITWWFVERCSCFVGWFWAWQQNIAAVLVSGQWFQWHQWLLQHE